MSLSQATFNQLIRLLTLDEQYRQYPYRDSLGILTIGIGRNLEQRGISKAEADYLLSTDINDSYAELAQHLIFFESLDEVRKVVLIDMCVNMGIERLLGFVKMLQAIKAGDYQAAANEMRNSKWAMQVHGRAERLAHMMETGKFYEFIGIR